MMDGRGVCVHPEGVNALPLSAAHKAASVIAYTSCTVVATSKEKASVLTSTNFPSVS